MARQSEMMDLKIEAIWRPPHSYRNCLSSDNHSETAVDEVATCTLRLSANDRLMTKVVDAQQEPHDGPRVSAFRLAEWLLWNWWRIRWEPARSEADHLSWQQAHQTASIGGGWLWPRITFDSDGQNVAITASGSEATVTEPVTFLGEDAEQFVSAPAFEQGVDTFVQEVISQLATNKLAPNSVSRMWDELQDERSDADLSTYRRFEALLGRNPDEGDEGVIYQLIEDRSIVGEQAANEVAANVPLTQGAAVTADSLLSVAQRTGFDISDSNGVSSPMTDNTMTPMESDHAGLLVPWQVGQNAAKSLRRSEGLGDCPIADSLLWEMCGLSDGVFTRSSSDKPPMAYTVSTKWGRRIVFRARVPTGRRFDAARLLGDKLLVRNGESLQPATRIHTFRQKMQRAFAAELLCPFDALLDRLDGDHSDDSIEEAANRFRVSPLLVATRLENSEIRWPRYDTTRTC